MPYPQILDLDKKLYNNIDTYSMLHSPDLPLHGHRRLCPRLGPGSGHRPQHGPQHCTHLSRKIYLHTTISIIASHFQNCKNKSNLKSLR